MSCNPNFNNLNPPPIPGIPIPGLGIPFSPIQLPIPGFTFPEGVPESLTDLINSLQLIFPSSTYKPNLDDLTNSILKAISNLLSQVAPFLSLYKFFQALLNIVLCVLEVLCAFPNPFRMVKAMRRLFKRCLPDFLNLFPWLALLAMIIALILLIIALIVYIINSIIMLVEEIIRNLTILGEGVTLQSEDATIAAAQKIAQLLCLIENLLAIFIAVAAVMSIIDALAHIGGRTVCGRSGNTHGDDVGCCDDSVCPDFIANNQDGLFGTQGLLVYHKQINMDDGGILPSYARGSLAPIRTESWQFADEAATQLYKFRNIIDPLTDNSVNPPVQNTFFPDGIVYSNTSNVSKIPYSLNMTLKDFDPGVFHPSDTGGQRDFTVSNVVVNKPYIGVLDYKSQYDSTINDTGTLPISGGLVYEEDGSPYLVNGSQATLQTFIHEDAIFETSLPSSEDGYFNFNVEYNLVINHEILMNLGLITLGCVPDIAIETNVVNARMAAVGFDSVINRIGSLPNVTAAHTCATAALEKFRTNVSIDAAATFQAEMLACLNQLKAESEDTALNIICNGTSIFSSEASIDTDIQFITRPITANVILKDSGGTNICTNLPSDVASRVITECGLVGHVTLGNISDFSYDGYSSFNALITSDTAGDGQLSVTFGGSFFSETLNTNDDTAPTVISIIQIPYTFIGTNAVTGETGVRRDETDVARDNTG